MFIDVRKRQGKMWCTISLNFIDLTHSWTIFVYDSLVSIVIPNTFSIVSLKFKNFSTTVKKKLVEHYLFLPFSSGLWFSEICSPSYFSTKLLTIIAKFLKAFRGNVWLRFYWLILFSDTSPSFVFLSATKILSSLFQFSIRIRLTLTFVM